MGDRLVGNGRVTSEGHPYFSATNQGSQWRSGGVPIHKISATEQMSLVEPPLSLAPDKLHVVGGSRPRHMPRYDWATLLSDAALDLILAVCSLTFLGFAVLAHHYDQAPVDGHQALTAGLQRATTYVRDATPIKDVEADRAGSHGLSDPVCRCYGKSNKALHALATRKRRKARLARHPG